MLNAFREVEDNLAFIKGEQIRQDSLHTAEKSALQTVARASAYYKEGETDLQVMLDTQRSLYVIQEQLAKSQLALAQAHVGLFKALGGGWEVREIK